MRQRRVRAHGAETVECLDGLEMANSLLPLPIRKEGLCSPPWGLDRSCDCFAGRGDPVSLCGLRIYRLAAPPSCLLEHSFLESSYHTMIKPKQPLGEAHMERNPLASHSNKEGIPADSMQSGYASPLSPDQDADAWALEGQGCLLYSCR